MALKKYTPVNVQAILEGMANWNVYGSETSKGGIPLAFEASIDNNNKAARNSYKQTSKYNDATAQSVADLLSRINAGSSLWAGQSAEDINRQASAFAADQARQLNELASQFVGDTVDSRNQAASRAGTGQAIDTSEELNMFTTLNTALLNNEYAIPAANAGASAINQNSTADVQASQAAMFGGAEGLSQIQAQINQNIQDRLNGNVSESTRRQLARNSISNGATELGGQAVNDSYTGWLGLTSEQLQSQGQQQFESLYGLYRQSVPIVSGAQLLDNYALSNRQASAQAFGVAGQLTGMGSITAQQLLGMSGTSAQQLTGMNGLNASQLYGTNSLNASQLYGTNSLSNETMFRTTSAPTSQLLGLTTLTPQAAIDFEFRNQENSMQSNLNRYNAGMDSKIFAMQNNSGQGGGALF